MTDKFPISDEAERAAMDAYDAVEDDGRASLLPWRRMRAAIQAFLTAEGFEVERDGETDSTHGQPPIENVERRLVSRWVPDA